MLKLEVKSLKNNIGQYWHALTFLPKIRMMSSYLPQQHDILYLLVESLKAIHHWATLHCLIQSLLP